MWPRARGPAQVGFLYSSLGRGGGARGSGLRTVLRVEGQRYVAGKQGVTMVLRVGQGLGMWLSHWWSLLNNLPQDAHFLR